MRYYIASPGFNPTQLDRIHEIEQVLIKKCDTNKDFSFFSPFTHGGALDLTESDINLDKFKVQLLFDENIKEIDKADKLIGIVDDTDKGTAFEIGYMIGRADCQLDEINRRLLLVGRLSHFYSELIHKAIKNFSSLLGHNASFTVIDITQKEMTDYILFGICYAYKIMVVTWANKPLESNLMSACATLCHYQWDGELNKLSKEQLLYELYTDMTSWRRYFGTELFQLSNMKFKSKME